MTFEPQPVNPLTWLIIALIGAFFFVVGFEQSSSLTVEPQALETPRAAVPPTRRGGDIDMRTILMPENASLLNVESVEALVRESFPPQVSLLIDGYWPDGCAIEPRTIVQREGDRVIVRIFRIMPPETMCTMVITPFETELSISDVFMEGETFRSGEYTIDVNGRIITLRL